MNQKKLALLFIGVNTSQWIQGNATIPLSSEINKLRADGCLFIIGDKESSVADDALALGNLRHFVNITDQHTVNWIIVRCDGEPAWSNTNFIREALVLVENNSKVFTYQQFFDIPGHSSSNKAKALYDVISRYNQQPQQETTMQQDQPVAMTNKYLAHVFSSGLNIVANVQPEYEDLSAGAIVMQLRGIQADPHLAPPAMANTNIQNLVVDLVNALDTEVELNKEEQHDLVTKLQLMIDALQKGDVPAENTEKDVQLPGAQPAGLNFNRLADTVATAAKRLNRGWAPPDNINDEFFNDLQIVERHLRLMATKAKEETPAMPTTMTTDELSTKIAEHFTADLQNLQNAISNEIKEGLQHLGKTIQQHRPAGAPHSYAGIPPMDSFPPAMNGFGSMGHYGGYNPKFPRGPIQPMGQTMQGIMPPENFSGVIVVHVEDSNIASMFDLHREMLNIAYPMASVEVISYDAGHKDETLWKSTGQIARNRIGQNTLMQHVLVIPSTPKLDMSAINEIRYLLNRHSIAAIEMTLGELSNPHAVQVKINPAIFAQSNFITQNSFGQKPQSHFDRQLGPNTKAEDFDGAVVIYVLNGIIDKEVSEKEELFRSAFPKAKFYVARVPEYQGQTMDQIVKTVQEGAKAGTAATRVLSLIPFSGSMLKPPLTQELLDALKRQKLPYREIQLPTVISEHLLRAMVDLPIASRSNHF